MLVGPRITSEKSSTVIPQPVGSPSTAHAEIHIKTKGSKQSFEGIENLHSNPSQEGNLCNLREGEGETNGAIGEIYILQNLDLLRSWLKKGYLIS